MTIIIIIIIQSIWNYLVEILSQIINKMQDKKNLHLS